MNQPEQIGVVLGVVHLTPKLDESPVVAISDPQLVAVPMEPLPGHTLRIEPLTPDRQR